MLAALEGLKSLSLINEVSGNRVVRFEHNAARALNVPGAAVALLTLLMLRGPQTAAELRLHTERLHRFADISSVEAFLDELATKEPPRVVKLARAPGEREARWAHLLCGEVTAAAARGSAEAADIGVGFDDFAALKAQHTHLAAEVAELRALVHRMARELGLEPGPGH